MLKEVQIRPGRVWGRQDTLKYDLTRFTSSKDRNVSDVLKKLPGINVEENGTIKYNGKVISNLYHLPLSDADYIKEKIYQFSTCVEMKNLNDSFDLDNFEQYEEYSRKIEKILQKSKPKKEDEPAYMIRDIVERQFKRQSEPSVIPCPFRQMNALTNAGGYPEHSINVILDKPKAKKTFFMVNLARGYLRMGKSVYYVDTENGKDQILDRFIQSSINKTKKELYSGEYDKLESKHLRKLARFGVELIVERVPAMITDCNYIRDKIIKFRNQGIDVKFDEKMNDPKVYKLWQNGESVGIFQFESQGMTNFMKELKPDCLEDIIAGVSLYRPGPMDQIPRYIANKKDPEHAVYTHPALKPILEVTYGCMVYQEQVMQIVRDLAGYSLGRADLVRRAMGKKKLDVMAKEREIFIHGQIDENGNIVVPGCIRNGIDEQSANKIFDEMAEFAKYAFNKSHAAAYAVISFRTAYLKAYYPTEFMAAMLNSFLGNLDKVPGYIEECKRLSIQILKPDINKSYTRFTVDKNQIRFGLGSIKNVGTAAVDEIVEERTKHGEFKDFSDFCERIKETTVNKKCIESLIKSGAMDEFNQTRATLLASYEDIVDSINTSSKRSLKGQITMFDMGGENDDELEKIKYNYTILDEFSEKELLAMEKEMLGLYITGHPLESLRHEIEVQTNINTLQMREAKEEEQETGKVIYKDGQNVKFAGIISSIKKKYTKTNKLMAFVTIEDLYGSCEVIVFENCYMNSSDVLIEDNIVMCEGRLSIREDEDTKIVANKITKFGSKSSRILKIDITDISEEQKEKLRGAIKFFAGDRNNIAVKIINGDTSVMSGGIFINEQIYNEFKEIAGSDRVSIEE